MRCLPMARRVGLRRGTRQPWPAAALHLLRTGVSQGGPAASRASSEGAGSSFFVGPFVVVFLSCVCVCDLFLFSLWEVFVWGFGVLFLSCACVGGVGVVLCRCVCVCVTCY